LKRKIQPISAERGSFLGDVGCDNNNDSTEFPIFPSFIYIQ